MASRRREIHDGRKSGIKAPSQTPGTSSTEAGRRRDSAGGGSVEMEEEEEDDTGSAASSSSPLPRWMRLYFYGMHGVTLDILLSALRGFTADRDPKLLGFSSPYLCLLHTLIHFTLEKIYEQKRSFRGRSVIFQLVFYPSVYIGLQILIGNVNTLAEHVRVVSIGQLAVHYLLALYFTGVFHRGLSRLRYCGSNIQPSVTQSADADGQAVISRDSGPPHRSSNGLPGAARFLFFGMHGLLDEVLFTSLFNLAETGVASGHTSLWSFLMYGSCSFAVERLYLYLRWGRGWGTLRRLPLYVCLIYCWELSWGLALRPFRACSWDYSHYPFNFLGLITLVYLPGWICLSLYQDVLSNILLRITLTD